MFVEVLISKDMKKIIFIICCFFFILFNNCLAQQNNIEKVYIDALEYIKTNKKVKEEVLIQFSSTKHRRNVSSRKYFKKDKFSFYLNKTIYDQSDYLCLNSYKDSVSKYLLDSNIYNSFRFNDTVLNKLDIKKLSAIYSSDTLTTPYIVEFSSIVKNYFIGSIYIKNYTTHLNSFRDSRIEILFILDENSKIKKTFFSGLYIGV